MYVFSSIPQKSVKIIQLQENVLKHHVQEAILEHGAIGKKKDVLEESTAFREAFQTKKRGNLIIGPMWGWDFFELEFAGPRNRL